MITTELLQKYDIAVPRYTSYPTVPYWKGSFNKQQWLEVFRKNFDKNNCKEGISLYIHLPFCESLCTYCGCNKKITVNHAVEEPYLTAVLKEWHIYKKQMHEMPVIKELHLGGGTPTFFSPENLKKLISAILKSSLVHPRHDFSFEGHPNNTTKMHLKVLYDLRFRRVSYGVQDHDPKVQHIINRIQPYKNVHRAVDNARGIGYTSVNFDLIYGLPLQTIETMQQTIEQSIALKPDRVAFYSYAHVPWKSRMQRLFNEHDLPSAALKIELYRLGKKLFTENGYSDIGMDHFALPGDDLYKAWKEGRLHRNFMGYTTQRTGMLLGLGVSSISDAGAAFAQNEKTIHNYYACIAKNEPAVTKGYMLNEEDIAFRKYILDISCKGETTIRPEDHETVMQYCYPEIKKLAADGLIEWNVNRLTVTDTGRHFIRNICKAFDLHLLRNDLSFEGQTFSKAV
jgi:oxygen-independent coproporphyrinogen III oxidase